MKGELARQFATLLKQMWSGQHSSFAPKNMKSIIGKKAPQFNGYQQHDAQELLAFLLDGLHEDLNRVGHPKPYIEAKDTDGKSDVEAASEAWDRYRMRDNSVIGKINARTPNFFSSATKLTLSFPSLCQLICFKAS
jgi:ubiquitin C-terminal hydrolase